MKNLLKNRKGQGATEYVVIVAIIVGALIVMWPTIKNTLVNKTNVVTSQIGVAGN